MAFLIDASSGVGRTNFQLEKAFVKAISSTFTITKYQSHIGLITYANTASLQLRFRQTNSLSAVRRGVDRAAYINRGGRRIDLALEAAQRHLFANEPNYIQRVMVVITGGRPNRRSALRIRNMARQFRKKGVQVYAVGVGRAYRGDLKQIAYKNKHVYFVKSFGSLLARANQLAAAICSEQVTFACLE